jgi:hypothetical protein
LRVSYEIFISIEPRGANWCALTGSCGHYTTRLCCLEYKSCRTKKGEGMVKYCSFKTKEPQIEKPFLSKAISSYKIIKKPFQVFKVIL